MAKAGAANNYFDQIANPVAKGTILSKHPPKPRAPQKPKPVKVKAPPKPKPPKPPPGIKGPVGVPKAPTPKPAKTPTGIKGPTAPRTAAPRKSSASPYPAPYLKVSLQTKAAARTLRNTSQGPLTTVLGAGPSLGQLRQAQLQGNRQLNRLMAEQRRQQFLANNVKTWQGWQPRHSSYYGWVSPMLGGIEQSLADKTKNLLGIKSNIFQTAHEGNRPAPAGLPQWSKTVVTSGNIAKEASNLYFGPDITNALTGGHFTIPGLLSGAAMALPGTGLGKVAGETARLALESTRATEAIRAAVEAGRLSKLEGAQRLAVIGHRGALGPPTQLSRDIAAQILKEGHKLPPGIATHEGLSRSIHSMFGLTSEGVDFRHWYHRSANEAKIVGNSFKDYHTGNLIGADKAAQLMAIYSQVADPDTAVAFVSKALKEYETTGKVKKVYFGRQVPEMEAVLKGQGWEGRKRNSYYLNMLQHIDPKKYKRIVSKITSNSRALVASNQTALEAQLRTATGATLDQVKRDIETAGGKVTGKNVVWPEWHPATIDRWVVRMADPSFRAAAPGEPYYGGMERMLQLMGHHLGGWHPSEVQAASWVPAKKRGIIFNDIRRAAARGNIARTTEERAWQRAMSAGEEGRKRHVFGLGESPSWVRETGADVSGSTGGRHPLPSFTELPARQSGWRKFRAAVAQSPRGWSVSTPGVSQLKESRVFLSEDGKAGYAIHPDGELYSVFNNGESKGAGLEGARQAAHQGAYWLNVYGIDKLVNVYRKAGFEPVAMVKFNPAFAKDAPKELLKEAPPIVFMAFGAHPQMHEFDTWDEARAFARQAANPVKPEKIGAKLLRPGFEFLPRVAGAIGALPAAGHPRDIAAASVLALARRGEGPTQRVVEMPHGIEPVIAGKSQGLARLYEMAQDANLRSVMGAARARGLEPGREMEGRGTLAGDIQAHFAGRHVQRLRNQAHFYSKVGAEAEPQWLADLNLAPHEDAAMVAVSRNSHPATMIAANLKNLEKEKRNLETLPGKIRAAEEAGRKKKARDLRVDLEHAQHAVVSLPEKNKALQDAKALVEERPLHQVDTTRYPTHPGHTGTKLVLKEDGSRHSKFLNSVWDANVRQQHLSQEADVRMQLANLERRPGESRDDFAERQDALEEEIRRQHENRVHLPGTLDRGGTWHPGEDMLSPKFKEVLNAARAKRAQLEASKARDAKQVEKGSLPQQSPFAPLAPRTGRKAFSKVAVDEAALKKQLMTGSVVSSKQADAMIAAAKNSKSYSEAVAKAGKYSPNQRAPRMVADAFHGVGARTAKGAPDVGTFRSTETDRFQKELNGLENRLTKLETAYKNDTGRDATALYGTRSGIRGAEDFKGGTIYYPSVDELQAAERSSGGVRGTQKILPYKKAGEAKHPFTGRLQEQGRESYAVSNLIGRKALSRGIREHTNDLLAELRSGAIKSGIPTVIKDGKRVLDPAYKAARLHAATPPEISRIWEQTENKLMHGESFTHEDVQAQAQSLKDYKNWFLPQVHTLEDAHALEGEVGWVHHTLADVLSDQSWQTPAKLEQLAKVLKNTSQVTRDLLIYTKFPGHIPPRLISNTIMPMFDMGTDLGKAMKWNAQMWRDDPSLTNWMHHAGGVGYGKGLQAEGITNKAVQKFSQGVVKPIELLADRGPRLATIGASGIKHGHIDSYGEYKAFWERMRAAAPKSHDELTRRLVLEDGRKAAGEYENLGPLQHMAANYVFLMRWLVASSRWTTRTIGRHPFKSAAAGYLTYNYGFQGNNPIWNRFNAFGHNYQTAVPYSTPYEIGARAIASGGLSTHPTALGGSLLDMINPLLLTAASAAGRRDVQTGTPTNWLKAGEELLRTTGVGSFAFGRGPFWSYRLPKMLGGNIVPTSGPAGAPAAGSGGSVPAGTFDTGTSTDRGSITPAQHRAITRALRRANSPAVQRRIRAAEKRAERLSR